MQSCDMEHFKEAARDAEKSMRGVFERTPLQKNEHLSAIYGADIWLKREDLSPVRSYNYEVHSIRCGSNKKTNFLLQLVLETMRRVLPICASILA